MTVDEFIASWHTEIPYIEAHTSGSTGTPKLIRLMKADMELSARATCRRFGISERSRLVVPLSMDYIAGKMMAVRSIVSGAELVTLQPSRCPLSQYQGGQIDLLAIVAAQIDDLLENHRRIGIRNVIIGGSPISARQEEALLKAGINAFVTYGMTETCSHVAIRAIGNPLYEAMPGISFSTTEEGCLVIDTGAMSVGRLVTRDVVELHSPTSFRWLGRADNCVISGGIKLYPEEIEARLAQALPGRRFYVSSRPSRKWGDELVLAMLDGIPDLTPVEKAIKEALPPMWRPKAILWDANPDYTDSDKLKRKKFPAAEEE